MRQGRYDYSSLWRQLRRGIAWMLVSALMLPMAVQAACSPSTGAAVLNEYYFGTSNPPGNFLEIYSKDPAFARGAWQGWTIDVYSSLNTKTSYLLDANLTNVQACVFGSKTFVTASVPAGLVSSAALVILRDATGSPADALVFDNNKTIPAPWPVAASSYYPTLATECPTLAAALDAQATAYAGTLSQQNMLQIPSYGNKDIARFPDGSGIWDISSNQGAGTTFSQCSSNSATLTKTSNVATVSPGGSVTYTVQFKNGGKQGLTGVVISDVIPSNWTYVVTVTAGTFVVAGQTITWNVGTIAAGTTATMTVTVAIPAGAAAGIYTNTATTTAGVTPVQSDSAPVTVVIPASNFNAFDTATVAGVITGNIQTKVAGSPFSLDVVALNAGAQASGFTNAVKVELLGNTVAGVALDANNCPVSSTLLQTVTPNPTLTRGRSTVNFAVVAEAWRDVRVRISYPAAAPTVVSCSSDNFAIRPNALTLTVSDADWQTAGTARILNNTVATGGFVHKAGRPFTLNATAHNALGIITAQYDGGPNLAQVTTTLPAAGVNGILTPGAWAAAGGSVTSNTATYAEVGSFNLVLQDTTFAAVDAADGTPATCAGYYVCSAPTAVGRFVPDHFALSAASIVNRADLVCPACTFTYMGEQMNASFTLTAQSFGGTTTQNYTGILAKLNPAAAGNPLGLAAVDSTVPPTYLSARLDTSLAASGTFVNGAAVIMAPLAITRTATPDGPYALLDIGIAPLDAEGVGISAFDLDTDVVAGNDHSKIARTEVRYGRSKVFNALGSEQLPLPVTVAAQYWNGAGYVNSTTDNQTQFNSKQVVAGGNLQVTLVKGPLAVADINAKNAGLVTLVAGSKVLTLLAPLKSGSADLVLTAPAYLPGEAGRVTFGMYKGSRELIYLREAF